jgi:hypothetical protein
VAGLILECLREEHALVPVPGTELWPTTVPLALGYPTCFFCCFSILK